MKAEPALQHWFSIAVVAGALAIAAAVPLAHWQFGFWTNRTELGPRTAELRFEPIALDAPGFAPLRLAGVWKVTSEDGRISGMSALQVDGGHLVALTDSGVVVRFPKPGRSRAEASIRELPGGPGPGRLKVNRDSEAFARDPAGRGWWVAFETRNELWLYSRDFSRALLRSEIPDKGLFDNRGIEGAAAMGKAVVLLPENGGRLLRFDRRGWSEDELAGTPVRSSDLAPLGDRRLLVVERKLTLLGIANALSVIAPCDAGYCRVWRKDLPLSRLDNVEGVAAESLPSGAIRLWMVTDDGSAENRGTLLIAAEIPPRT